MILLWLLAAAVAAHAQTAIDLRSQTRNVDFSSAVSTRPAKTGTVLPAACQNGELFFKSDASAGSNLYGCVGSNTWAPLGGSNHTHALTDINGITGKQGAASVLLAFGGGTAAPGDCALFDANGSVVPSPCPASGGGSLPLMTGNANRVLSNDGASGDWRVIGLGLLMDSTQLAIDTAILPRLMSPNTYTAPQTITSSLTVSGAAATVDLTGANSTKPVKSGTTLPPACGATEELFIKRDATPGLQLFICNASGTGWNLLGNGAPGASYITQTPDATLTGEQALSSLATGLLKNTTGTGVLSVAAAGTDYAAPGAATAYAAGIRQTFQHDSTSAGIRIAGAPGDPSSPLDGDLWYNTTAGKFRKRENGAVSDLVPPAGSGNTLVWFRAQDNEAPAAAAATSGARNSHRVLEFDATANESALFSAVLPRQYSSGGVTVTFHFALATATTGSVVLCAQVERIGDEAQDIDVDGFAAAKCAAASAVPAVSGNAKTAAVSFADGAEMDSLAAGESFRLKVYRDAASAGDDAVGDLQLLKIEVKEN